MVIGLLVPWRSISCQLSGLESLVILAPVFPCTGAAVAHPHLQSAVSQQPVCPQRYGGRYKAVGRRRRQLACQTMSEVTVQLLAAGACHSQALLAYVAAR